MPPDNRRQFERFPFSSRLEVRRQRATEEGWTDADGREAISKAMGVALDVSVGGFGFRSPTPLRVGDVIAVSLLTTEPEPDVQREPDEPLEIRAIVRHVSALAGDYVIGAERHG